MAGGVEEHAAVLLRLARRYRGAESDRVRDGGIKVAHLEVEMHHRALLPVDRRPDGDSVVGRLLEHKEYAGLVERGVGVGSSEMLQLVWRTRISGWTDQATFNNPAPDEAVRACEAALGQSLPQDLADLLRESNGVAGEYGLGFIWPVERIREDNLAFRANVDFAALYMPFEPLLFFADAGNGDQFAFVIRDRPADVFLWDHETDSRSWGCPEPGYVPGVVARRPD